MTLCVLAFSEKPALKSSAACCVMSVGEAEEESRKTPPKRAARPAPKMTTAARVNVFLAFMAGSAEEARRSGPPPQLVLVTDRLRVLVAAVGGGHVREVRERRVCVGVGAGA